MYYMYYTVLHVAGTCVCNILFLYMYATVIHLELDGIVDTGVEVNTSKFSLEKSPTNTLCKNIFFKLKNNSSYCIECITILKDQNTTECNKNVVME